MTTKRKSQDDALSSTAHNKKSRLLDQSHNGDSLSIPQPKVDPTYGQRGAFPGLDDVTVDDGLYYRPANDGLEYLRMVRHEAKAVPNLLVAPTSRKLDEHDLYADYSPGFYSDGAYIAPPPPSSTTHPHTEKTDPQEAYYTSLIRRFTSLHTLLHSAPSTTQSNQTATLLMQNKRAVWRGKLLKTTPTMKTLGQLPQDSVICGLEVLGELLTRTNLKIGEYGRNLGAWAWGLLGACRDVGEMGSEDVGIVRAVGKQAAWLLRRVAAGEAADAVEEEAAVGGNEEIDVGGLRVEREERGIADAEDKTQPGEGAAAGITETLHDYGNDPVAAAQQRLLSSLQTETPSKASTTSSASPLIDQHNQHQPEKEAKQNTNSNHDPTSPKTSGQDDVIATLDMIVTIAGEVYGQRDLLEGRLLWDEI
ncbi:MAG: hypothetical protein Q9217_005368 [Psora testacea]